MRQPVQWHGYHFKRLTLDEVIVGLGPAVAMVGGQDPNWFLVGLEGCVPDLLQLNKYLVGRQGAAVAAVDIQLKELGRGEERRESLVPGTHIYPFKVEQVRITHIKC